MLLNDLKVDEYGKIVEVNGEGSTRHHLLDMGVIPGAILKINKYAPMGDPIEIQIHGYNLTLRLDDAKNISVEKTNNQDFHFFTSCTDCSKCNKCQKNKTLHPGFGESGKFHDSKTAKALPESTTLTFALVGNQNTGKTTLFNQLTGSNQHIGNFPGVTVDKKSGQILQHKNTLVTDLPGVYSLSPYSTEEKVTRDFILNEKPHCIINIIDANNIERNLNLTLQLLELEIPTVLALNMMDEVISDGGNIDINKIEEVLGIPVIAISAVKNSGIDELVRHAIHIAKYQEKPKVVDFCNENEDGGAVHRAIHSVMHLIEDHAIENNLPKRFAATKIIENDLDILDKLKLAGNEKELIEHICLQLEDERKLDRVAAIEDMRFDFIRELCEETVCKPPINKKLVLSNNVDKILTGKYTGIPIFILIMGLIFFLTFNIIGPLFQNLLNIGIGNLAKVIDNLMTNANVSNVIHSLIIDGIFAGVGSVLSFIPIILILFLFLSLLEDSGYMARVAFVMDKLLRKLGISGRSIVPLIIGFGCTVPGVMATRTIPSDRDRKITIMLLPFITCTAKLPIYGFFANAFFPSIAGFIMISLYIFSMFLGILYALFTKKFYLKGEAVPFIMELPNYRFPSPINVIKLLWEKAKDFLERAFTIILIATIIIWFLGNFDARLTLTTDSSKSLLAMISGIIAPVFSPMGLNDYRVVTSLISGFLAKESVVSTITVLYGSTQSLASSLGNASVIALLVFSAVYTPCVAAIAAIKRELGIKFSLSVIIFQCVLAYIMALLAYTIM